MARASSELESNTQAFSSASSERASRLRLLGARTVDASHVVIPPVGMSGFHIDMFIWRGGTTGDFGGLVHEFDDFDQALWWAERCFGENCRLRIDYAGDVAFRWALEVGWERGTPTEWLASGSRIMTLAVAPTTVRYLSNYEPGPRIVACSEFEREALRV